jgi:hypothetical protein
MTVVTTAANCRNKSDIHCLSALFFISLKEKNNIGATERATEGAIERKRREKNLPTSRLMFTFLSAIHCLSAVIGGIAIHRTEYVGYSRARRFVDWLFLLDGIVGELLSMLGVVDYIAILLSHLFDLASLGYLS